MNDNFKQKEKIKQKETMDFMMEQAINLGQVANSPKEKEDDLQEMSENRRDNYYKHQFLHEFKKANLNPNEPKYTIKN